MIKELDIKTLFNTVCVIRATGPDGQQYGGHGCLILPDLLLTSWHVIQGMKQFDVINGEGKSATMVKGSPLNKRDRDLDLATIELTTSLTRTPAVYGDTDKYLQNLTGHLVTRFTGEATIHKAGVDPSPLFAAKTFHGERIDFISEQKSKHGYSGSPVFDSRGRLSSLLCGVQAAKDRKDLLQESHGFFGPAPYRLAGFIRRVLDLNP